MTNRDRLARMSNQELADEIKSWDDPRTKMICMCPADEICLKKLGSCVDRILEWLEMEVGECDAEIQNHKN